MDDTDNRTRKLKRAKRRNWVAKHNEHRPKVHRSKIKPRRTRPLTFEELDEL